MPKPPIPRFLLPRGSLPLSHRHRPLQVFLPTNKHLRPACKNLSTTSPLTSKSSQQAKPRTLAKPSKFTPPSHGARLNRKPPRQYPGPPLSATQLDEQKTKQYPHMMPPEGSFMHWFLTSRGIHLWITLGTLFSLATFTFINNFHRTSHFAHLLPPANSFLAHPLSFISQYTEVYKLHTAHISAETAERRRKKVEDVQKRSAYRKAHGLANEQGFGGWTAKDEKEALGPSLTVDGAVGRVEGVRSEEVSATLARGREDAAYVDWEGRRKPVKKWLGIW